MFISCNQEKNSYVNETYQIVADNEALGKDLRKIVLGHEYKRLSQNLALPEKANDKYKITWQVTTSDYVEVRKSSAGPFLKISRDKEEFVHFVLTAKITDEKGNSGTRTWDCYIVPLIYRENNEKH